MIFKSKKSAIIAVCIGFLPLILFFQNCGGMNGLDSQSLASMDIPDPSTASAFTIDTVAMPREMTDFVLKVDAVKSGDYWRVKIKKRSSINDLYDTQDCVEEHIIDERILFAEGRDFRKDHILLNEGPDDTGSMNALDSNFIKFDNSNLSVCAESHNLKDGDLYLSDSVAFGNFRAFLGSLSSKESVCFD